MGGRRPFHMAIVNFKVEICHCLVEGGAYINQTDNNGWTPFHLAVIHHNVEVCRYLISVGANRRY